MKRLLPVLLAGFLALFSNNAIAQWVPITNLINTTQNYGGINVNVTGTVGAQTGGGCGGLYWIQQTNSSYTFTFSTPVDAVWIQVDAINTGESIEFIINGSFFPITNCNLDPNPFVNNCSVNNCNIVNGQFVNNTTGWVCGGVMIFYGPITTFTINEPIGGSGTTFNISFAPPGSGVGGAGSITAGSNSPVCLGGALNLTSTNSTNYSWIGPNGFTSNQQNPTISPVTQANAGTYYLSSNGPCGMVYDTITVLVSDPPVVSSFSSTNPTTCGGSDGTITLNGLTPNAPYTINYDINGTPVSMPVNADGGGNIVLNGLTQGVYTALSVISGNCPPLLVGNFTLTDPPIPAAPTINSNSPVCEYGTLTLTAGSVPGGSYTWNGPNGFSSVQQNPSITNVQLNAEGNYNATVTVANCVSAPSQIFVDIIPLPAPPVTANITYCQYDISVPLTATGTALLWYTLQTGGTGTTNAPVPNTNTPGVTTYFVSQTVNGCEGPRSPIQVTVIPQPLAPVYTGPVHFCRDDPSSPLAATGQNLQWYDNNNNLLPGAPTPATSVPGDFVWYVTQTVNNCESPKTTINIHIADIPPAPVTADITYCQFDEPVALTAIGQDLAWYNAQSGTAPLVYPPVPLTDVPGTRTWWVSQTVDGCESPTAPLTVTVNFLPSSTFEASRPLVCENETLTFTYTGNANGMGTYAWTWAHDSVILVDGVTNTPGPLTIRFDEIGTFPITLTVDSLGCNTTFTYNVKVAPIPDATATVPPDVCIHDSVTVGLGSYNQPFTEYNWSFDGGTNVLNHINEGVYQIQWTTPGIHIIEVEVGNSACSRTFFDTVLVHNAPDARFSLAEAATSICIGDSLRLTAIDNNGLYSYEWSPAAFFNETNNFAPVVNAYVRAKDYITLKITTPWGCEAEETVYVDAQSCCNVALPNAFTPNGDGKNDIFRPITQGNHAIKQFVILDRWGKKIYESLDIKKGWDGTFNGEDQDMGTYFYLLRYKCEGKTMDLKGEVILVR